MAETKFVLVVEDDPILKNLLGHTFAGKYQTLYASGGEEGLQFFEQYKPAIVLLDLMLPGAKDGFAVLEAIRARTDALKTVPIIVVSNLGQEKDIQRAKSLGANDYLVKAEVSIEEIVAKIESTMGGNTAPVSAPAPLQTEEPSPSVSLETPPSASV
jgi:DNA-binding response OmpR family regulator